MASSIRPATAVAGGFGEFAILTPAAAYQLIVRDRLDLVLLHKASRDGLSLTPLQLDTLAILKTAASAHHPGPSVVASLLDECPHGHDGRPQIDPSRILLTTAKAAQRIKQSERTVRRLIEQRQVHAERISGRWMVEEASVEEYLEVRRKESA